MKKDQNKLILINAIRVNNFKFDPLTPIFIPKNSFGDYRMVCVPSVKDRLIQLLFIKYLEEIHPLKFKKFSTNDFALKGNGGVKAAHDKLSKFRKLYKFALKTDISSFFDELDRKKVVELFKDKIDIPDLDKIFNEIINADPNFKLLQATSAEEFNKFSSIIKKKRGRGIRQGMPIASLLASFYLQDFETVLENNSIKFIRYADDLVVFGNTEKEIEDLFILIKNELSKVKLTIPEIGIGKTETYNQNQTLLFLGLELRRVSKEFKLFIPKKSFQDLNTKVIQFQGYRKNIKGGLNFYKTCQKLDLICNGYLACYEHASNLVEFKNFIQDKKVFVYKRLLAPIGVDYASLTTEKKKYFFNE
ncbi:reverse transcriptase domain-containing protein [Acinetobacter sp. F16]|uniref:reverse transcriptase domain-containing protein n=1 Tax=Acinetobacter sp. F16 TaxID=3462438 RepID=UPI004046F60C